MSALATRRTTCLLLLAAVALAAPPARAAGRRLYVAPRGEDSNDGLSRQAPLRTLARAAALVAPGDVVEVAGGVYRERVTLKGAGKQGEPIVFRAAPHETAVVTGGRRLSGWRKAPGTRSCWSTRCLDRPADVWEDRTVTRLMRVGSPATLEATPGSYLYDKDKRVLKVHALRSAPAEEAGVVVVPMSYRARHGFAIDAPHNTVEGFTVAYHQGCGIAVKADHCRVLGNTVYGCIEGVTVYGGDDVAAERNECFRNDTQGLIVRGGKRVTLRSNLARNNGPAGPLLQSHSALPMNIHIYSFRGKGSLVGKTAVVERGGGRGGAWRYKGAGRAARLVTRGNVMVPRGGFSEVQWGTSSDHSHNTVVGGALRAYEAGHPVVTPALAAAHNGRAEGNLYTKAEDDPADGFADPARRDYRPRRDSPHLGKGAFPKAALLRYVSPDGDDARDGRTLATAWKTIRRATAETKPGETVYLLPGTYREAVVIARSGTAEQPIRFMSYGRGRVVLDGRGHDAALLLRNAGHVVIDGLTFRAGKTACVRMESCANVTLRECVLRGGARGVAVEGGSDLSLLNDTFYQCGTGVEVSRDVTRLLLRNNLFAENRAAPVVPDASASSLVSARNGFSGPAAEEQRRAWRARVREAHPSLAEAFTLSGSDVHPPIASRFCYAGLGHKPVGARGAREDTTPVRIEDFRAASLLPKQVVLSWRTPHEWADAKVRWQGPNGARGKVAVLQEGYRRKSRLLTRIAPLAPGKRYKAVLEVTAPDGRRGRADLSFATPKALRAPATLYVAADGDDANDGLSRRKPLKTLTAASLAAAPGDTVLVAPGVYAEAFHLWCGGLSKERRLTFRSEGPREAVIDCESIRIKAIQAKGVKHVTVDGFRFARLVTAPGTGAVEVTEVEDFALVNNAFDRIGRIVSNRLFIAWHSRDLLVRGNFFDRGFYGVTTVTCRDVTIDHNTFYGNGITGIQFGAKSERGPARARITNNIFMDTVKPNKRNPAVCICYAPSAKLVCDHNLYGRDRAKNMALFGYRWTPGYAKRIGWGEQNAMTVEELRKRFGVGRHSKLTGQVFVDPEKGDFRLRKGSPAVGMASDGGVAGVRWAPVRREP